MYDKFLIEPWRHKKKQKKNANNEGNKINFLLCEVMKSWKLHWFDALCGNYAWGEFPITFWGAFNRS